MLRGFLAACGLLGVAALGFLAVPAVSSPPCWAKHHTCPTTTTTTATTTTVQTTTTEPTTTTVSVPSGSVVFDGRAKLMSQLSRTDKTDPVQVPVIWSCLCFTNNDLSLASDDAFGQAYKAAVPIGDTNPWGGSSTADGAGQLSVERPNDLGKWDWYAVAVKINSWAGSPSSMSFSTILSAGYQTSQSDQVALGLQASSSGQLAFSMHGNAGFADNATGYATGTVHYKDALMPVVFGQWREFVVGIRWATDSTGQIEVFSRPLGGSWTQVYTRANQPTYLYGTTQYGTFNADGSNWGIVLDKLGFYYGGYPAGTSETVYESGVTRSTDMATAESTLP